MARFHCSFTIMAVLLGLILLNTHFLNVWSIPVEIYATRDLATSEIKVITGTKLRPAERILQPYNSGHSHIFHDYPNPLWRASAYLQSESGDQNLKGTVLFHQWSPTNFVRVTVDCTGVPPGKHAVHVHAFGDVSQGCASTGPHMANNFVGNIEAKEDGVVSDSFYSSFLTMFGYIGIVGRSVVIHSNAINQSKHPAVFSSATLVEPLNESRHQSEENAAGAALLCGVITITDNREQFNVA